MRASTGRARELLGGHVGQRARLRAGARDALGLAAPGQAEVDQDRAARARDQHVRGLDVAVHHAAAVGVLEGLGHLARDAQGELGPGAFEGRVADGRRVRAAGPRRRSIAARRSAPQREAGSRPSKARRSSSSGTPSTSSIAYQGRPCSSPPAKTWAMPGWHRPAAAATSRRKRSRLLPKSTSSGRISLTRDAPPQGFLLGLVDDAHPSAPEPAQEAEVSDALGTRLGRLVEEQAEAPQALDLGPEPVAFAGVLAEEGLERRRTALPQAVEGSGEEVLHRVGGSGRGCLVQGGATLPPRTGGCRRPHP